MLYWPHLQRLWLNYTALNNCGYLLPDAQEFFILMEPLPAFK